MSASEEQRSQSFLPVTSVLSVLEIAVFVRSPFFAKHKSNLCRVCPGNVLSPRSILSFAPADDNVEGAWPNRTGFLRCVGLGEARGGGGCVRLGDYFCHRHFGDNKQGVGFLGQGMVVAK